MNQFLPLNPDEAVMVANKRIILPGRQEPEWLKFAAEHERVLREIEAEQRATRPARPVRVVRKLRTMLARS
ncbi:MAG: hypothetical protein LC118_03020 [Dehalococcoidia bacterium]|nr:hypothetical protein [Dehalococcoidia bacterium]